MCYGTLFVFVSVQTPGVDKAKAYMESVTYFMKHGDALEVSRRLCVLGLKTGC